jgi:hypothetical protein
MKGMGMKNFFDKFKKAPVDEKNKYKNLTDFVRVLSRHEGKDDMLFKLTGKRKVQALVYKDGFLTWRSEISVTSEEVKLFPSRKWMYYETMKEKLGLS